MREIARRQLDGRAEGAPHRIGRGPVGKRRLLVQFFILACQGCAMLSTWAAEGSDEGEPRIYVGRSNSYVTTPEVKLAHGNASIRIEIEPKALRYRYRMEGLDDDWPPLVKSFLDEGEMIVAVRFYDQNYDQIAQKYFGARGDSAGWAGSIEGSTFTPRNEKVPVPEGARYVYLGISSSGPPETVGYFAITGLRATSPSLGEVTLLDTDEVAPGESGSIWNKSGTHPSMALTMLVQDGDESIRALVTRDDDILAHADWSMSVASRPRVEPGETLEVSWNEVYSVGKGGPLSVMYERLPPGAYRFVVQGLDLGGRPLGEITSVAIKVPRPYWETIWFWGVTLFGVATFSSMWGRNRVRRRLAREQRHAQLIDAERLRIASDLHDDLGTRLSHINLLGSHAGSTIPDGEVRDSVEQITQMSRELMATLSETVWMLNANNSDLESLVDFLCRLVGELCKLAGIRCRIDALSIDETMPVSHEFRHNVSLAVKEIVNNALKHASASELKMRIVMKGDVLRIEIADNGVGIGKSRSPAGSGLQSVRQRMESLGGTFLIEEKGEGGVQVTLEAPV